MAVTITERQRDKLKKNIEIFYRKTKHCRYTDTCPIKSVLAPSVDKWSIFCFYMLAYNDTMRFNELKSRIKLISSRMLSVTLKRMEHNGIVQRKVYPEVPPRVEYTLTTFGWEFARRLLELNDWVWEQKAGKE